MSDRVKVDLVRKPGTYFCSKCHDVREFINADGEVEACDCLKILQLYTYAKNHFRSWVKVSAEFRSLAYDFFDSLPEGFSNLVLKLTDHFTTDEVRALGYYWLLWQNRDEKAYRPFIDLTMSDAVEIYFGRFDVVKCVKDLTGDFPLVIFRCGWGVPKFMHYDEIVSSTLGGFNCAGNRTLFIVENGFPRTDYPLTFASLGRYEFLEGEFSRERKSEDSKIEVGSANNYKDNVKLNNQSAR